MKHNIFNPFSHRRLAAATLACAALFATAQAQLVEVVSTHHVSGQGFYPQINDAGTQVLYSTTEADKVYLLDLGSGNRTLVVDEGTPGYEANFGPDGKVYYITTRATDNHLLYRTAHEWNPENQQERPLVTGQRGALHAVRGTQGMAVVGEHKNWNLAAAGTLVWTLGRDLFVVQNGKTTTHRPVPSSVGLLWSQVSPSGKRILFEAAGKGLTITDLNGRVEHQWGVYMMPSWLTDDLIVAQTRGNKIVVLEANTGRTQTIASGTCYQPMVAGRWVIFSGKGGNMRMMKLALPGEQHEQEQSDEAQEADNQVEQEAED